jgi:hypothetical protein
MKNKLVLISFILALLAICLTFGEGAGAVRDQEIQSEVIEPSLLPIWTDNISSYENVTTINQTYEMKTPTFKEVKDFILKDPTSRNTFVLNKYECRHFATDVNNNADAAGLRCAFVLLCYRNGQHAVVAFDTTDRGMIYIEPQTDAAIQPEVGGKYQGEEIIEILISW